MPPPPRGRAIRPRSLSQRPPPARRAPPGSDKKGLKGQTIAIRRGSGGKGQWHGGDGSIRRIRFLDRMTAIVVASRRNVPPFGLAGGADGAAGRHWVERADGTRQVLTGTDSAELNPGDAFVIETPGGGGYGAPA